MNISLDKIDISAGTQSREKIDERVVAEYADAMKDGAKFPPIKVMFDGLKYYPYDGHHRFLAAKRVNAPCIDCDVTEGTARDAQFASLAANPEHGLQRTAADKRKIVMTMLLDFEWQEWSDRQIASHCRVSHPFVSAIRKEMGAAKTHTKYKRDGKTITREEPKQKDPVPEFTEAEVQREEMRAVVDYLKKQNEELQDQLTVAQAASIDDIQKEKAESIIKDLRAQIRALEIELKEITVSRDMYQRENGELKKQVASLLKKLKKLEG